MWMQIMRIGIGFLQKKTGFKVPVSSDTGWPNSKGRIVIYFDFFKDLLQYN